MAQDTGTAGISGVEGIVALIDQTITVFFHHTRRPSYCERALVLLWIGYVEHADTLDAWCLLLNDNFHLITWMVTLLGTLAQNYQRRGDVHSAGLVMQSVCPLLYSHAVMETEAAHRLDTKHLGAAVYLLSETLLNEVARQPRDHRPLDPIRLALRGLLKYEQHQRRQGAALADCRYLSQLLRAVPSDPSDEELCGIEASPAPSSQASGGSGTFVGLHACASCGVTEAFCNTMRGCSRCRRVWYCDAAHQRDDWPRHRVTCRALRTVPGTVPGTVLGP